MYTFAYTYDISERGRVEKQLYANLGLFGIRVIHHIIAVNVTVNYIMLVNMT
jgi:hypothetical protein